ncbi:MAG: response regulator [Anaerolineae bacterium]|jgi:CheY-like chemotaxis protein
MLTIEITGVLLLLVGVLIYAMVRSQLQKRAATLPGQADRAARILIVDDDPDFVKITKKILESHGYDTDSASNGAEGLKVMRSAPAKPDLVLLDIMMDYITDGLDVSNAMQRDPNLRDIPVVMVTSLTGVKSQELFPSDEHVAASAWLSKPVSPDQLLHTVRAALARVPEVVPVGVPAVS